MKISPVPMLGSTVAAVEGVAPAQSMSQKIRALRMNTNATPGRVDDGELSIPVPSDPAQAVDEATKPLSPQFAALAKQKRALQVQERALADREKALSGKLTQSSGVDIARLKSDPLGILLENGVTYEQLTQAVLANNSGITPELQRLQSKIDALEAGVDKKLTDRDTQQEQQALAEMRREALQMIATGNKYKHVRVNGSVPDVIDYIHKVYKKDGSVLEVKEALDHFEQFHTEQYEEHQKKLAEEERALAPPVPQPRSMRTLTNRDTASVPMSAKARALAAFAGTLKR